MVKHRVQGMEPGYCASSVYNEDTVKVIGIIKAMEARYLMVGY